MKKLITRVVFYLLAILLLGCFGIGLLIKIYPERFLGITEGYKIWKYQQSTMQIKYPKKINAIIGDSRGSVSLNPLYLGDSYINFSLPGSFPFDGFITLQRLLKNNKIDTVVLCYSAVHFETGECFYERTLSFSFIDYKELNSLFKQEWRFHENIETARAIYPSYREQIACTLRLMHFPLSYRSTIVDALLNNNSGSNNEILNTLYNTRGHILFNERVGVDTAKTAEAGRCDSGFYLNPVILGYMDMINDLVVKNNIKCFLLIPTESEFNYKILLNSRYYNEFNAFILSLETRYPNVTIIKNLPYIPNFCFTDGTHVNEKGAKIISDNFVKVVTPQTLLADTAHLQ